MCDNKNELQKSEYDESVDYTSTRLDLDITETTDSYPEFDFLDLLRSLQVKEKKAKHKIKSSSEVSSNKSNLLSDEDSEAEALAKLYEEKYGTCNDYAELGEGYDEEDSFIDNSDAVNDLVPSGIQTEFGGFYINRGKLNFVKEDNSSSSASEDADKFLALNRLNTRKIISDVESDEKESCKVQSNNQRISNVAISSNIHNNNINNNSNNNNFINSNSSNNHHSNNNNSSLQNNIIKSRKKSGEFQHKNKKIRKTATPKIPDHLLYKKPFSGSLEYRKNINEFKKNRLKTVESDKKSAVVNSAVHNSTINDSENSSRGNNTKTVISSNNNNNNTNNNDDDDEDDDNDNSSSNNKNNNYNNNANSSVNSEEDNESEKKEPPNAKRKPLTVKELLKERDGASEVIEAVATGQQENEDKRQSSSSSESSETSTSESDSESSEDTSTEKAKIPQKSVDEPKKAAVNGSMLKDVTAKSFAHLSDGLKELIAKVFEISKEEKNKLFNSKLNSLLLSMDDKLRELPMTERNAVLEHLAEILQMKKDNITKRTKKLLVVQEETKMSGPLRKLKDAVANMMPLLESNYFNEYTKAAGTSPQIYAELSRYYWSIDPCSLPQRKFPWNDDLRQYLREIVQYRKNCYYIIRPRKESLIDYIRSFMETKVRAFWPKEWMTVDILLEEAQVTNPRQVDEKQKVAPNFAGTQSSSNIAQKKVFPAPPSQNIPCRKAASSTTISSATTSSTAGRKPVTSGGKNAEVKSILIPRKTPQGINPVSTSTKSNFSSSSSSAASLPNHQGSRLQVTLNRLNVQEYLDRMSVSQQPVSRTPSQQISPNRSQQSVSPNRLVKTSSPNPVINSVAIRPNTSQKNSSSCSVSKSISSASRTCNTAQSVLKTIGMHSNAVPVVKTSPNSVTITPVHDSMYKDISPGSEVLNLTKNSSVYVSKVKESSEPKTMTSSSSIGIPLPSGITISPTNATPSTFLAKPQKQGDRNPDIKNSVSITKQESGISLTKEKREPGLNMNIKREGPLQNIPDCISVTSKVVSNERPKYEHVRKRALHEYHLQQHSPERLKSEEKKMKKEDSLLTDIEIKEDKLDDKNFSKIFDSVIAKTSETVRQSESASLIKPEKFSGLNIDPGTCSGSVPVKNPCSGVSQFKSYTTKLRDVRGPKEKQYYPNMTGGSEEKIYEDAEDRSEPTREQLVQMEMDRVMQNLVELSKEKNAEYEMNYHSPPPAAPAGLKSSSFQEVFQKMLFK